MPRRPHGCPASYDPSRTVEAGELPINLPTAVIGVEASVTGMHSSRKHLLPACQVGLGDSHYLYLRFAKLARTFVLHAGSRKLVGVTTVERPPRADLLLSRRAGRIGDELERVAADGWLVYDFRGSNPAFSRLLTGDAHLKSTRR